MVDRTLSKVDLHRSRLGEEETGDNRFTVVGKKSLLKNDQ